MIGLSSIDRLVPDSPIVNRPSTDRWSTGSRPLPTVGRSSTNQRTEILVKTLNNIVEGQIWAGTKTLWNQMLTGDLSKPDALPSNGGTCANQVPGKHQPNLTFNDQHVITIGTREQRWESSSRWTRGRPDREQRIGRNNRPQTMSRGQRPSGKPDPRGRPSVRTVKWPPDTLCDLGQPRA